MYVNRIFDIICARPVGSRILPSVLQLSFIVIWHYLLFIWLKVLDNLHEWSQRFWFQQGISDSFGYNYEVVETVPFSFVEKLFLVVIPYLIVLLIEALISWFGFRLFVRRRPKLYRFIRYWWRTCLYGTIVISIFTVLINIFSPLFPFMSGFTGILLLGTYILVTPGFLAFREINRRQIRLAPLCPFCRYWLHAWFGKVCPECGTTLLRGKKGGYVIAPYYQQLPGSMVNMKNKRRQNLRVIIIVCTIFFSMSLFALYFVFIGNRPWYYNACILNTTAGPVKYFICCICDSARIEYANSKEEFPIKRPDFNNCNHMWQSEGYAWSSWELKKGDVLLIKKEGTYNTVKIISVSDVGGSIQYEWYHQPDSSKGTFTDKRVEKQKVSANGMIAFKNISISINNGCIWYDFYYGGVDSANPIVSDPHHIAYAGKVDISTIDASDIGWIYKTWEDGKPNGYRQSTGNPDRSK
ncbi:MAG: hypothetical protein ACYTBZ_22615 [Planctomycetota bacterium]|jgi:hypothetical protein